MDMYITTGGKKYILRVRVGLLCMAISSPPLPLFLQRNNLCTLEMYLKKGGAHKSRGVKTSSGISLQHGSMASVN